jgi:hypothetical protein
MAGFDAASKTLRLALLLPVACTVRPYEPCPVAWSGPLPADAFATCQRVLAARYGALQVADPEAFLLQSAWAPVADPPGERRASVFLDRGELAVVVEVRWVREPVLGLPEWSSIAADQAAERQLAVALAEQLAVVPPR